MPREGASGAQYVENLPEQEGELGLSAVRLRVCASVSECECPGSACVVGSGGVVKLAQQGQGMAVGHLES